MDVIFMGTPDFAVPVLRALIDAPEHRVRAVVTQPDRARGRSGKPKYTPVKELAVECGIPVYTPERVGEPGFIGEMEKIPCDAVVVVAFGQILPAEVLHFPKFGCINVHASLLPRWRGAAPMQWAILSGDVKTGVTVMQMDEGIDTGDMLLKKEVPIEPGDTGGSLHDKLKQEGGALLLEALSMAEAGTLAPEPQRGGDSTYAGMLTKEMGRLAWEEDAESLERRIRALNPWPGTYASYRGKTLKLWRARVLAKETGELPGTVVEAGKDSVTVQTGRGCLEIVELQLEGKKRMDAGSFLRGVHMEKGDRL